MRYYSTQRPVSPGTYPKDGVLEIHNFDFRQEVPEIGCKAWGYLEYDRELSETEMSSYELVSAEQRLWYGAMTVFYDTGKVLARICSTVRQAFKPENTETVARDRTIYIDWFATEEAADEWVQDALNA